MKLNQSLMMMALCASVSLPAFAGDYTKNPFSLVYDGAITENKPGQVNIHPVTYKLNGIDIVANVYTPANYDPSKKYEAIVVAHPNGGVKEQVAGLYAQRLAEKGYITITADAAYQGAVVATHVIPISPQTVSKTFVEWPILSRTTKG